MRIRSFSRVVPLALLAVSAAVPVQAASTSALDHVPSTARPQIRSALERVDAIRESAASGSLSAFLRAVLPGTSTIPQRHVTDPVARLTSAVRAAERTLGVVAPDLLAEAVTYARALPTMVERPGAPPSSEGTYVLPLPLARAAAAAPAAMALVVRALDDALPALRARVTPRVAQAVEGCDVVSQLPNLCIGSSADNTYREPAALLIDLGGNDTYLMSAGGAPVASGTAWLQVSVNVDLAGNDTYASTSGEVVQGSGMVGGIGVALDASGNDTYTAHVPATGLLVAQGAGFGSVGALLDLGGNDLYRVTASDGINDFRMAVAQGAGNLCAAAAAVPAGAGCAAGILLDSGGGDDAHEVQMGTVSEGGERHAFAQGAGGFGTGVLADDGGTDAFEVRANATVSTGLGYPKIGAACPGTSPIGTACVLAQGYASVGAGLLLTGAGDTTYDVALRGSGWTWNLARTQGVAGTAGLGVIDDLGGNDRYATTVENPTQRTIVIDDACSCPSTFSVSGADFGVNDVVTQGSGMQNADLGLVNDRSGNDTYRAVSTALVDATIRDERTSGEAARLDVRSYGAAGLRAQGSADTAIGVLIDGSGDDTYDLRTSNASAARGSSTATAPPVVSATSGPIVGVGGQGMGQGTQPVLGALIDLGGRDEIRARTANPAQTSPDPAGARSRVRAWPPVQGAFGGILVALGDDPVILSSPSRPACKLSEGPRGFGRWHDCVISSGDPESDVQSDIPVWTHANAGHAPTAVGAAPSLTFTSTSTQMTAPTIDVETRLVDAVGAPLSGVTVHLDLQSGCFLLCAANAPSSEAALGAYWSGLWTVDAVTDANGIARASVPTANALSAHYRFRVLATFDGSDDLYPRHTALQLSR